MLDSYRPTPLSTANTLSNIYLDTLPIKGLTCRAVVPIRGRLIRLIFNSKEVTKFLNNYN